MAKQPKLKAEEKWRALPPAMKVFNIFLSVAIVAGILSGITVKLTQPSSKSSPPAMSATAKTVSSPSFSKADAFAKCTPAIEARVNRPETINYKLLNTTFVEDGDNARFTITGTGENAFGAGMEFRAYCYFKNGRLTSAEVTEG